MTRPHLEIRRGDHVRRVELPAGLLRLGGAGTDVVLEDAPGGELHLWDDPPKLVLASGGAPLRVDGEETSEALLTDGARVRWGEYLIAFHAPPAPVIEEIEPAASPGSAVPPAPAAPPAERAAQEAGRAWELVRAGLLVDLGLTDRAALKRWREAVLRGEFDPAACARDLAGPSPPGGDDPRLVERARRLLRDFLMADLARGVRGASRRARAATKSGVAMLVAQATALLVYTAVIFTILVLVRKKWGLSVDGWLDAVLGR